MKAETAESSFILDLKAELDRAEKHHAPLHSLHEAYAVILEEVDELWEETRKKREERSKRRIRSELIQIAAMAWRCARDMGIEDGRIL